MLTFAYSARDTSTNKVVKSTVQAESERAAAKLLMSRNLVPIKVELASDKSGILDNLKNRVTTKDRVIFSRQLSTLISAGLPLAQSLHTVQAQTANTKLKGIIQDIITSVEGGKTLADSFSKHDIFNDLYIALIASGEVSGTLDKALERIASQQEKEAEIVSKVRGAMVYPLIVLAVIMMVVIFMLTTVVPQIENLYVSLKKPLPLLTDIMVQAGHFVTNFWWLVLLIIVAGIYLLRRHAKTVTGRRQIDTFKLNVPLFKDLFRKLYMARFCRTGETLLQSGVQMLEMLRISARSVGNVLVQESINRAGEKVRAGKALSTSIKTEDYILPLVPQMIGIGEQSGGIDAMMGKAATFYETEVDNAIKNISTAIEPLLMVALAVVAGGMVGAILMPIYGLVGQTNL